MAKAATKKTMKVAKPEHARVIKGNVGDYMKMQQQLNRQIKQFVARNIEKIFLVEYAPALQAAVKNKARSKTFFLRADRATDVEDVFSN
jgi:hypothetical protein